MKKLLSVVLAVIMLLGCASVAFADGNSVTLTTSTNSGTIEYPDDTTLIINNGVTYTNEGTIKLRGGAIVVNKGGHFENKGSLIVEDTTFTILGEFNNYLNFPGSTNKEYPASTPTFDRKAHTVVYSYYWLLKSAMTGNDDYLDIKKYQSGSQVKVPYGDTLYVMIDVKEGDKAADFIDTSRIRLSASGGIIDSSAVDKTRRGIFVIEPINAAAYQPVSLNYKDVVTQFDIELPAKEGKYAVKTDKDEYGHAILNYGETLTVTVELAPEYDQSEPIIYINAFDLHPDKYGYFDINVVKSDNGENLIVAYPDPDVEGRYISNGQVSYGDSPELVYNYGVRAQFSMTVAGIMKNDTKQKFTNVLQYIKQIFDVFKEVFASLKEALSGLFG